MAEKLDSKEISSFEELLMSNVYTQEALGGFFIIICQKCDNKLTQKLIPKNCPSIPLIPNSLFCILKPPQSEFLSIQFSGLRVLGMGRDKATTRMSGSAVSLPGRKEAGSFRGRILRRFHED